MAVELAPGVEIAEKYTLRHRLGEGGMGLVWAANETDSGREVALKFIKGDSVNPELRKRFIREAKAACAVRHEAIVDIHDILELEDGSPVLVMEFLHGESLAERLDRQRKIPLREFATIMQPVISAVGTAHSLGIVHRDLKPENIFLAKRKDGSLDVKVLDFGIAKLTAVEGDAAQSTSLTGSGTLLGTPYYMAPEQIFGEKDLDHRTDVWALGVILYEALSGMLPTEADNIGQVLKIVVTRSIAPLANAARDLPEDITDLVDRMLSRRREDRPEDLREVHKVFKRYGEARVTDFGAAIKPIFDPPSTGTSVIPVDENTFIDPLSATAAVDTARPRRRRITRNQLIALGAGAVLSVAGIWWVSGGVPATTESAEMADAGAETSAELAAAEPTEPKVPDEPDEPPAEPEPEPTVGPTVDRPATAKPPRRPKLPRLPKPAAPAKPTSAPTAQPAPTKTDPSVPPIGPKAWE